MDVFSAAAPDSEEQGPGPPSAQGRHSMHYADANDAEFTINGQLIEAIEILCPLLSSAAETMILRLSPQSTRTKVLSDEYSHAF
jgi:hypothetical protein